MSIHFVCPQLPGAPALMVTQYCPGWLILIVCVVLDPTIPGPVHKYGPAVLDVKVMPVFIQVPPTVIVGYTGSVTVTGTETEPAQLLTVIVPALATALLPCQSTVIVPEPWPVVIVPKLLLIVHV